VKVRKTAPLAGGRKVYRDDIETKSPIGSQRPLRGSAVGLKAIGPAGRQVPAGQVSHLKPGGAKIKMQLLARWVRA
jgi:hypothetical protein